jgi:hypothetical protein
LINKLIPSSLSLYGANDMHKTLLKRLIEKKAFSKHLGRAYSIEYSWQILAYPATMRLKSPFTPAV